MFAELPGQSGFCPDPGCGSPHNAAHPDAAQGLALREALDRIERALDAASEERYQEMKAREKDAAGCQRTGDMHGWNFHQGMSAGMNWADIIYRRIGREVTAIRALTPPKETPDGH